MNRKVKSLLIESVCAVTKDYTTLQIAKWWEMKPSGNASKHLDQYLEGRGNLKVDLLQLFKDDPLVLSHVKTEILFGLSKGKSSGVVPIRQSKYTNDDWRLAIGSMNINWKFPSKMGPHKAHVGFRNKYRWHPNVPRITQCIHQAADRLKAKRAKEYWMEGSAEIEFGGGRNKLRFHVVKAGDTLEKIAGHYYRNSQRWTEIQEANKAHRLSSSRPSVGLVIRIP